MYFNIIASGSKGNATLIKEKNTLILIDMGVSLTTLTQGLKKINQTLDDIDACFFTHDHSDHIKGVQYLKNKKLYALKGTLEGIYHELKLNTPIQIKDITITPVLTSHDAINPCGFIVESLQEKLVYITDTGYIPESTLNLIKHPTYLIIESNHDVSMLMKSNRSMDLKRRILSDCGHLCNEDAAIYACNIINEHCKQIVLAHLSEECNQPQVAIKSWKTIFDYYHIDFDKFDIITAWQYQNTIGGQYEN